MLLENAYDLSLFVFNKKHVRVYQRLFHAEMIAEKEAEIIAEKEASVDHNIRIPLVLMKADVDRGWNKFQRFL